MKFFDPIDLQGLQLKGAAIETLAAAPTAVVGRLYFDTALNRLQVRGNSAWGLTSLDTDLLQGQNGAFYLGRANHTGTQLAATISDLATTVKAYRLDEFAAPNADLNLNSRKITNLADPVSSGDAVTLSYLQTQISNAAAGIDAKPSVRVASTANLTLSGAQTIDGVSAIAGDRVLAKNQTTASGNGVYVVAAGAWSRATDGDASAEMTPGAFWYVEEGTANGKTQWRLENTGTITLGTTSLTINQFGGAGVTYTAGNGISLAGNAITAVAVASGGISVVAGGLQVDTAIVARKFSASIGNGSLTSIAVTHSLGTKDVSVTFRLNSTDEAVYIDWVATDTNNVTVTFSTAPASNAIRVTVIG